MKFRKNIATVALAASFGIALTFSPLAAYADTSAELQAQLDAANATLDSLYAQAEEASEKVNQTQEEIDNTQTEIDAKQKELSAAQDTLAKRVNSNYKTGGVSLLSILFDSSSFEDLVSRITYASKVSTADAEVIQNVKTIQAELDAKKNEQEQLLAEQQSQQAELESAVAESESYVSSLSAELQEAIAAEQAAQEAEQAAARQAAEANANTNTNTDADTTDNSNNNGGDSGNSGSDGSDNGSSSGLTQSQRDAIVAAAWAKVGCSYVYGATGPNSYDCSGFTQYCYAAAGISLPRTSGSQGSWGHSTSNPQAGDLVCWGGHVGIYMGGGMMIDAGNPRVGVSYRAAYSGHWFRTK